jgi:hypothetical protein
LNQRAQLLLLLVFVLLLLPLAAAAWVAVVKALVPAAGHPYSPVLALVGLLHCWLATSHK